MTTIRTIWAICPAHASFAFYRDSSPSKSLIWRAAVFLRFFFGFFFRFAKVACPGDLSWRFFRQFLSLTFSENGSSTSLGRGAPPGSRSLPSSLQRHLEPQLLQATNRLPRNSRAFSLIKVVAAQVLIGLLPLQNVIGNDEDGVCDLQQGKSPRCAG